MECATAQESYILVFRDCEMSTKAQRETDLAMVVDGNGSLISITDNEILKAPKCVDPLLFMRLNSESTTSPPQKVNGKPIIQNPTSTLAMFSRTIKKSLVDSPLSLSTLPPTFLLPSRARYLHSTLQHVESPVASIASDLPLTMRPLATSSTEPASTSISVIPGMKSSPPPSISTPIELSPSVKEMLPLLAAQPGHYISAHIHGRPYLVTAGDTVRLPFLMPGVLPGDVLRLNRASSLGSRDYTLKGEPYLDERIFECRARVMGVESEPMRSKEKKKQRTRRMHTVKSKHKYTILRISEVKIRELGDIEGGL